MPAERVRLHPPSKPDQLIENPQMIHLLTANVYTAVRERTQIHPEARQCTVANALAAQILEQMGVPATYHEYEPPSSRGVARHAFVEFGERVVFDLQYQQFVPQQERAGLASYLVIPFGDEKDVIAGLKEHHVPKDFYEYWLAELFWQQRQQGHGFYR